MEPIKTAVCVCARAALRVCLGMIHDKCQYSLACRVPPHQSVIHEQKDAKTAICVARVPIIFLSMF